MPVQQFINGSVTVLTVNSQLATDVSIAVNTVSGLPSVPQFTLLNRRTAELMLVTAISGITLTVTRAIGGTTAIAMNANDYLDYSITREMLMGGFVSKLDEQILSVDTANPLVTLTVPTWLTGSICRNLRVWWDGISVGTAGNAGVGLRFNGDTGANYIGGAYVYHGSGASSGVWSMTNWTRTMWIGRQPSGGAASAYYQTTETLIEISSAFESDRWKSWHGQQRMMDGNVAAQYHMQGGGTWKSTAAISSISIGLDDAQNNSFGNGTLKAGFRAILYGCP